MIYNVVVICLIIASFIAGLRLDNYYHTRASISQKEALEKQFVRLRVNADADDPVRPYGTPQYFNPIPVQYYPEPRPVVDQNFMDELKTTGKAKKTFRKSDLTR